MTTLVELESILSLNLSLNPAYFQAKRVHFALFVILILISFCIHERRTNVPFLLLQKDSLFSIKGSRNIVVESVYSRACYLRLILHLLHSQSFRVVILCQCLCYFCLFVSLSRQSLTFHSQ